MAVEREEPSVARRALTLAPLGLAVSALPPFALMKAATSLRPLWMFEIEEAKDRPAELSAWRGLPGHLYARLPDVKGSAGSSVESLMIVTGMMCWVSPGRNVRIVALMAV